jgi:hypothetical protein
MITSDNTHRIRDTLRSAADAFTSRWFWRVVARIALIDLASLLLLGISFFLIVHGTLMMLLRLSPYSAFARRLFTRLWPQFSESPLGKPLPLVWLSAVPLVTRAIAWLFLVAVAFWILASFGPCGQNLLCSITTGLGH